MDIVESILKVFAIGLLLGAGLLAVRPRYVEDELPAT